MVPSPLHSQCCIFKIIGSWQYSDGIFPPHIGLFKGDNSLPIHTNHGPVIDPGYGLQGRKTPEGPAIHTPDTVYLGFGLEAIDTAANRNVVMQRVMSYLGQ